MTSVQTILHPTDFSRCAERAFQAACSLARGCGAQVIVLHVLEPVRLSTDWLSLKLFRPPRRDRWETLRRLRMREPDVRIEPVLWKGAPTEVILDVAREVPCDLIVMGVAGEAKKGPTGLSAVAAEVAGMAPCPVIILTVPRLPPSFIGHG